MAKRKPTKTSIAKKQYNQQVSRIKRFIKSAEQRGYRFENKSKLIPPKPKRITQASVAKLKKITPEKLYNKATYLSESGKVISGTQGRKEERSIAAKKAAKTIKLKKLAIQQQKAPLSWEEQRRQKDQIQLERLKQDSEYRALFTQGNIIYNQIIDMINDIRRDHQKAADHLQKILEAEINTYGKEDVMRSIGQAPEEILEIVDIVLRYNPGDNRHDTAIKEFAMLIKGTIPTAEELREIQDAIDEDISFDV